ncbi:hypothetical protein N7532_005112 [Penicillium argentinense]|uniref:UBC core domain-containing protein n=1 Tax=Penicillium argentinense TaxID=1131581 RepID=A0A9W9FDF4_9EURO|nr:uncharacterized protein N7532_005112 [Penicillium argentinense]KAJ5098111.1 hypothetical protein N7532_005112 [Penicillium argentinense]
MASASTRRLLKESTDLHKNPSPYFAAAPVSDSNLHDWHFTLVGPPSPTPYAKGLYHGRITFPSTYPLRPPSFRFLTPSARFEVNREICLSMSAHHEETWQPAWGVRTALMAIRSVVFSGESKGQVGGMEGSEQLRREYAELSRGWVCRECGGSNEERMREWWGVCREMEVEVDVEGFDEKQIEDQNKAKGEEGQDAQNPAPVPAPESEKPASTPPDASAAASAPAPEPAPAPASTFAQTPTPTSPAPAPAVNPARSVPESSASTDVESRPRATPTRPAIAISPENSPWLDRAIVCVVVALVILILRRTIDIDDL